MSDLPPEAAGRLGSRAFASGLTVPDFAACLDMGMQPVALVQGYCVMRWASPVLVSPLAGYSQARGISTYRCPHNFGYANSEHRAWGSNTENTWVTSAWAEGFNKAYNRMIEEAEEAGAHGVIGVVDSARPLIDGDIREFHLHGTAVRIEGEKPPPEIWTTYLAGARLAKLVESGLFPVSVVASMTAVWVWPACSTEILLHGRWDTYGTVRSTDEVTQIADAEMQARRLARDHLRGRLGSDRLHGASLEGSWREFGGTLERTCTIRGTRVRRFRDAAPLPAPRPTVRLG